jgi:hypothetical protein
MKKYKGKRKKEKWKDGMKGRHRSEFVVLRSPQKAWAGLVPRKIYPPLAEERGRLSSLLF